MHGKSSVSEVKNVYDDVIAQFENVGEAFDAFISPSANVKLIDTERLKKNSPIYARKLKNIFCLF